MLKNNWKSSYSSPAVWGRVPCRSFQDCETDTIFRCFYASQIHCLNSQNHIRQKSSTALNTWLSSWHTVRFAFSPKWERLPVLWAPWSPPASSVEAGWVWLWKKQLPVLQGKRCDLWSVQVSCAPDMIRKPVKSWATFLIKFLWNRFVSQKSFVPMINFFK